MTNTFMNTSYLNYCINSGNRHNREFYKINDDDFYNLIKTIEMINNLYDTEDKLLQFIKNFDNEYYRRRFNKKELYVYTL